MGRFRVYGIWGLVERAETLAVHDLVLVCTMFRVLRFHSLEADSWAALHAS